VASSGRGGGSTPPWKCFEWWIGGREWRWTMRKSTTGYPESPTAVNDVTMIILYTRKFIFRSILNKFMCAPHKGRWLVKPPKPNYACNNSIKLPPIPFPRAFAGRVWGSSATAAAAVCMTICHNIIILLLLCELHRRRSRRRWLTIRKRDLTSGVATAESVKYYTFTQTFQSLCKWTTAEASRERYRDNIRL